MQSKPLRPVIDRSHPLAKGLVGAWHFEDPSQARDLVQGQHSTRIAHTRNVSAAGRGAVTTSTVGYSLPIDGPLRYAHSRTGQISIEAWLLRTGTTAFGAVLLYLTNTGWQGWGIRLGASGTGMAFWSASSQVDSATPIPIDGRVHHVIVTVDSTAVGAPVRFYLDGKFTDTINLNRPAQAADGALSPLKAIGADTGGAYSFPGNIYSARVWDRVLSAQAVADLYADPWALYRTPKFKAAAPFAPEPVRKAGFYRRGVGKVKPVRPVLNRAHPLARGLVSAFSMSPQENLAVASRVVSRDLANGSLITGYGLATNTGPTKWGRGVSLDGGGAEGLLCNSNILNTITGRKAFSMSAHVWRLTAASEILTVNTGTLITGVCGLSYSAGLGGFLFNRYRSGISEYALATATPPVSAHLVGTYDGVTSRIYVDGVLRGTVASSNNINNITSVSVGGYVDGGFTGISCAATVADARVWSRCLSPSEVASLYADPWGFYRPPGIQVVSSLQDEILLPPVGTRRGGYTRRKGGR